MKNTWKKAAAFAMALALVVGAMPANVGTGGLFGGTAITASAEETTEYTIDMTAQGFSNVETVNSVQDSAKIVTVTFDKGSNSSPPRYYTSGDAVRVYGGGTMTVSADSVITSIEFTFGSTDGRNAISANTGTYSEDDRKWTSDGSTKSVTFTVGGTSGNRRIQALKVTVENAAVPATDISTAAVNLADDNRVESIKVGDDTITDLSGFDITYGTDESHTATAVPTDAGTYYAYVTPKSTNTAYTGTAKSSSIVVQHGHSYGQPTWSWGDNHKYASAEFVCTSDDDTQTVDAVVTYVIQGNTVIYTATATFDGIEYTDTQEVVNEDVIKVQSDDVVISSKQNVTFSVGAAEGCEYQWYYRESENDKWKKLKTDDSTSPSLTLEGHASRDGYQFCCKVTNGEDIEKSEIVTLNYDGLITKHPTDVTILSNQNATFEVEAENGCTYQWYYRKDKNDKWRKVKTGDSTSASLTMAVNSSKDGYQYRCKVTKGEVSEVSKTVTLNFNSLITMQPEDQTVGVNEDAVFDVYAIDACSYQWYYRKNETDKWIKLKTDSSTSPSLIFKGTYTRDGYQFRCKVMNDDGASVSDVVTLNILD